MKRNKIACECGRVTYGKVEDAIKAGASSLEDVQEKTGCGKNCGKCMDFLPYLVRDLLLEQSTVAVDSEKQLKTYGGTL
ncbi:MAG: (2Fe-2S)-binding protein [Ruminiclostridium sp.]|nr:(2Fe-2S)-binding protein [Ruminiclostridium sp.]